MFSVIAIGSAVPEKQIRVLTLYGHGGHLDHVTWIIYINIGTHFLKMIHVKFGFDWQSGFREEDI